ncbi:MAG: hypothetical protein H6741_16305 [Alphaproteobacteria bacterium]|nr:hypothetical protein [Alphaproteobacteria bacterium]
MLYALLFSTAADVIPLEPYVPPATADAAAALIAGHCGDIYGVQELAFTFVVVKEGEEVARRRHVWHPQAGDVTVSWEGFEATLRSVYPMEGAEGVSAEDVDQAHGAFINDAYWLMAPCKVLDPGVNRSLDDQGRLVLSFEGVGRTPGDVYRMSYDPNSGEVGRWDFTLQSGREGAFTWEAYQQVGPLRLATLHKATEGDFVIRFEDVSVR